MSGELNLTMSVSIRPLDENDLPAADRICRVAFGTFLGLPEPEAFAGDADFVGTRWRADPAAAFAAVAGSELVGSNFAGNWGSIGFFGPLTVRPDLWNQGIAQQLIEPVIDLFTRRGTRQAGLFTFSQSPRHVHLYQKFGFWPRFLTALMSRAVAPEEPRGSWARYSELPEGEREACLKACRDLTDALYAGLDLEQEIRAVAQQHLGDTVLLWDNANLAGLAVCHCGAGSEAGSGTCYVKFGAVRPGPAAEARFDRLLDAGAGLATALGAARLLAGVNTGRCAAYRRMLEKGFRTEMQGIAMHRPNDPGYNRPDVYLIDDWR